MAVVNGQTTTHNVALTAPVTTIDTSPIIDTVDVGDTALYARYLYNTGTAPLEYLVTLGFDDGGLLRLNLGRTGHPRGNEIFLDDTWISVASGDSGTVAPDDSVEIVFLVDFRDSTIVVDSTYQAMPTSSTTLPAPFICFYYRAGPAATILSVTLTVATATTVWILPMALAISREAGTDVSLRFLSHSAL